MLVEPEGVLMELFNNSETGEQIAADTR